MKINAFDSSGELKAEDFDGLSTDYKSHSLPFELNIKEIGEVSDIIEENCFTFWIICSPMDFELVLNNIAYHQKFKVFHKVVINQTNLWLSK